MERALNNYDTIAAHKCRTYYIYIYILISSFPPPPYPLSICLSLLPPCTAPQGTSKYVVVLVDPSQSGLTLVEGLKRMRIILPSLAAVVGVTILSPQDAQRLAKKSGLLPSSSPPSSSSSSSSSPSSSPSLLSDPSHQWMDAHGIPRLSLRPLLLVLDGTKGTVLLVVRDPVAGALNDLVMEVVGDWRGRG